MPPSKLLRLGVEPWTLSHCVKGDARALVLDRTQRLREEFFPERRNWTLGGRGIQPVGSLLLAFSCWSNHSLRGPTCTPRNPFRLNPDLFIESSNNVTSLHWFYSSEFLSQKESYFAYLFRWWQPHRAGHIPSRSVLPFNFPCLMIVTDS